MVSVSQRAWMCSNFSVKSCNMARLFPNSPMFAVVGLDGVGLHGVPARTTRYSAFYHRMSLRLCMVTFTLSTTLKLLC